MHNAYCQKEAKTEYPLKLSHCSRFRKRQTLFMAAPHGTSNNGMGEACPLNGDDKAPTSSDHPATIVQDGLEIFVPRFRS